MSAIKKTLKHPKANEDAQLIFQKKIKDFEQKKRPIIYIDESGFAVDMPRTHGYSPTGKRCYGIKDWHAKSRINVVGALLGSSLLTISLFSTNINSETFASWTSQDLIPKLPQNSVIVMDNATFHKREDIKNAIKNAGHTLEYLPPYSPDLNPIEHKWNQAKAVRRKLNCSVEAVFENCYL